MLVGHMADAHLGYRQYGLREREEDFFRVFEATVDEMLRREVDVILIAGDLFDKRVIRPETRERAVSALLRTQRRGLDEDVPVLVVHGNHDRAMFSQEMTWLDSLALDDCVTLLDGVGDDVTVLFVQGVGFVGLGYQGYQEREELGQLGAHLALSSEKYIILCHIGVAGSLDHVQGGLTPYEFYQVLPKNVLAVCTGHFHCRWSDGFIFQPGPLSPCAVDQEEGGFYLLDVDPARFKAVTWNYVPVGEYHNGRVFETVHLAKLANLPVGNHPGSVLNLVFIEEMPTRTQVEAALRVKPLKLLVNYAIEEAEVSIVPGTGVPAEIEREVLSQLLPEGRVQLALSLKEMALTGASAESIVEFLEERA